MGLLQRIFGGGADVDVGPLYAAVIAEARAPEWYLEGSVPDTIDGRFEALSLVMALVLLRLETDGKDTALPSARLAEAFVSDMDGQMRETGFGDLVVGKQVSKIMGALGGRLGAYREGFDDAALIRNLWRGDDPGEAARAAVRARIAALQARLAALPTAAIIGGALV